MPPPPTAEVDCAALARDVVEFLVHDHWLSDERFAAWHVEQRTAFRPRSRMVLLSELANKVSVRPSVRAT